MIKIMEPDEMRAALKDRKIREISLRTGVAISTLSMFCNEKIAGLSLKNTIKLTEYFGR